MPAATSATEAVFYEEMARRTLTGMDASVHTIVAHYPHRPNALNPALATALREYFQGLQRRLSVRVVILQAAGAQFCVGLDLKEQEPGGALGTEAMMAAQHSIRDVMIWPAGSAWPLRSRWSLLRRRASLSVE